MGASDRVFTADSLFHRRLVGSCIQAHRSMLDIIESVEANDLRSITVKIPDREILKRICKCVGEDIEYFLSEPRDDLYLNRGTPLEPHGRNSDGSFVIRHSIRANVLTGLAGLIFSKMAERGITEKTIMDKFSVTKNFLDDLHVGYVRNVMKCSAITEYVGISPETLNELDAHKTFMVINGEQKMVNVQEMLGYNNKHGEERKP
jgi:hypothetical protein